MREWHLTPKKWRKMPEADRDLLISESVLVCQQCGNLKSFCSKPGTDFWPQREECYVTATRDLTIRLLRKKYHHEPNHHELHPLDGVNVWMAEADLAPEDDFFDLEPSVATDEPDGEVDPAPQG